MPKEHQGGTPEVGHVSVSNWTEEHFAVPIQQPVYPKDDLRLTLLDAIKANEQLEPILDEIIEEHVSKRIWEAIAMTLAQFYDSKNRDLVADQIAWASGLAIRHRQTAIAMAKKNHVSKQTFVSGAHRIASRLGLRASISMRSEAARDKMRATNKRQTKQCTI